MKNKKALFIAIPAVIVVAIIVIIVIINSKNSYRIVKVNDFDGEVEFTRDKSVGLINVGMNLKPLDNVKTKVNSSVELQVDNDKYIFVKENTSFYINAVGDSKVGDVTIDLEYGEGLFEIQNKLSEESTFEVRTPNAICSVRGTKFTVSYDIKTNTTNVSVDNGIVLVTDTKDKSDARETYVNPGESIIITDEHDEVADTSQNVDFSYSAKTTDKSETFTRLDNKIVAKNYFKKIVFEGNSDVVKNINDTLNNSYENFFSEESNIFEYASSGVEFDYPIDTEYYDYVEQSVTYMDDKYVSVVENSNWYAGGVSNTDIKCYVFDLSTGNQIHSITEFTVSKDIEEVKEQIIMAVDAVDAGYDTSEINTMKAEDFKFYISENGSLEVCFGAYELGYGGWVKEITIPMNYK